MFSSGTTLIDIVVSVGRPRSSFPVKEIGVPLGSAAVPVTATFLVVAPSLEWTMLPLDVPSVARLKRT